jgi:glycosyltransferase involved in cell wall biosynthesis
MNVFFRNSQNLCVPEGKRKKLEFYRVGWRAQKRNSIMAAEQLIAFVSNMNGSPWGGSEELWAQTASLLAREGFCVRASVHGWSRPHTRIVQLGADGVTVKMRRTKYPLWWRAWNSASACVKIPVKTEFSKLLAHRIPALVVFSSAVSTPPIEMLQECIAMGLPFVTISQANSEYFWPEDSSAKQYRKLMPAARRCYFVSRANLSLFENQIGCDLPNAEIVCNPYNVNHDIVLPWPPIGEDDQLRLACVARLNPPSKGQDILLEALAYPVWKDRNWHLTLYGEGTMQDTIEQMIQRLGLQDRVKVAGFVASIEKIWTDNHVLVMPSRYEGLPLAMVEAMLCARPAVATDVAGHSEVLQDGVTGFLADAPTVRSVNKALERLWTRRMELETMGKAAARSIRQHVPADPARVFAEKIKALAATA